MEYVEAEGHSIDDAIERALQRLGVSRDKVDVEIISNSTRGLFGLGGRRAKVRATLRRPLAVGAATEPEARRAAPPSREVGPPPTRPQPFDTIRDAPAERRGQPRRDPPRPTRQRAPEQPRRDAEPVRRAPAPALDAPDGVDGASLARARGVLAEVVRLTGSEASVEVAHGPDGVRLVISGDASGVLIGRRGQTLDALEYVLNRIMAHEDEPGGRLVVDADGYRLRRRRELEELARRVAEQARRRGKPVALDPMSPRDRRIVHLALQNDPTLTTRSAGTGFYRKVVIVPAGARRPSRSGAMEQS